MDYLSTHVSEENDYNQFKTIVTHLILKSVHKVYIITQCTSSIQFLLLNVN